MSMMYCTVCDKLIDTDFITHNTKSGECEEY